jgi:KUP system potassium uptake protein
MNRFEFTFNFGGWIPLAFASVILFTMTTWKKGRELVLDSVANDNLDLKEFIPMIKNDSNILSTHGTSVFLSSVVGKTPASFMHNLKHNHVLHENLIFLTMITEDVPFVSKSKRYEICKIDNKAYQVIIHLGFKELPNIPQFLKDLSINDGIDWTYNEMETSFFLTRETILYKQGSSMNKVRESFFSWLSKNSTKAAEYFKIPSGRVVELGSQIHI